MTEFSAECDALLKSHRWEFGNQSHIYLMERVKQLNSLRKAKRPNKKEIERIEKIIISQLKPKEEPKQRERQPFEPTEPIPGQDNFF